MADTVKRSLARNLISEAGVLIAIIALANIIFLIYIDVTSAENPYLGILTYVIVPAILVVGILLFLFGLLWERRRRRRAGVELPEYPEINLNVRRVRNTVYISVFGGVVFLLVSVLGSYRAYHYTDSDQFCGATCHTPMTPEYTAYKLSPHARVGCVGCHVGPGASWYVRSKLSGAYQLYAVLSNKFPRPIPTPVKNLRPAQQTCEQCHWPEKFWGAQLKVFNHFAYDEASTPRQAQLLIKTGGGSAQAGLNAGIHWHMNIANEITYVASDEQRQNIDYVKIKDRAGRVTEYFAKESKLKPEQIAAAEKRRMDCIDCHNRPTHIYTPPDRAVDRALVAGTIDRTLPFVKAQTVDVLSRDYKSTQEAVDTIGRDLRAFWSQKYPAVFASKRAAVDRSVATTQSIFRSTRFPEMKVDWRTHPDNIGHFYFKGCFRCHDNEHVSKDGKVISKDCHICHDFLGQAEGGTAMFAIPKKDFTHPIDLGDLTAVTCADCHTGKSM